MTKPAVPLAD